MLALSPLLKWSLKFYIAFAALIGTVVMSWPVAVMLWNGLFAPAPAPVYLPNGFIYKTLQEQSFLKRVITGHDSNAIIIAPDVQRIMWHENILYGFRRGPANEIYYFICTYGQNCSGSQHYTDTEFSRRIARMSLPEFSSKRAYSYEALLRKQSTATASPEH